MISNNEIADLEDIHVEYEARQRDVSIGTVTLGGNHNRTNTLRFARYGVAVKALEQ